MPTNPNQNEKVTNPEDNTSSPDSNQTKSAVDKTHVRTFHADVKAQRGDATHVESSKTSSQESTQATGKREGAVVHTFKDDVQHLVRNKKMSMTRIAALESDRRGREANSAPQEEPKKTGIVVALSVLFVVIAAVFGLGAWYLSQGQQPTNAQQLDPALIFVEARERADISDLDSRQVVELLTTIRRNTFSALGSVVELYLLHTPENTAAKQETAHVSSIAFLTAIDAQVPLSFTQTLQNEYMLGIHVIDENVPFLILKTQSYGHAFSGMIAWEPYIESDLLPFFSPATELIRPAAAEGANAFTDDVIENIDVRVLSDAEGRIRIMYAFIDRSTIVLTTDVRTLTELANRLRVQ